MNRAQKNKNPVNLRFAGQTEAVGKDDLGFAIFPNDPAGWRAAHAQIELDQKRGLSLEDFIFKFAPPIENDTNNYLRYVTRQMMVNADIELVLLSKYALAGVMARMEGYFNKEE
jgi:hypothetical protein